MAELFNTDKTENTLIDTKKLSPLDRQYLKGAILSIDFYDDLGDKFWFGKDDCNDDKE